VSESNEERPERSNSDRPAWKKGPEGSNSRGGERAERPKRSFDRPNSDRPRQSGAVSDRAGRDASRDERGPSPYPKQDRPGRAGAERDGKPRPEWQTRVERPRDPERTKSPMIPEEITEEDLDLMVRVQMKTLSPENQERVARHLAMVKLLIDADPELAHQHALAAADRAGRIAIVRETVGLTAYTIGDFALALREMQTYRRLSGKNDQLPIMVDSERGMGRPERALELGRSVPREELEPGVRANLAIAMSGARLDRGENDLALAELEIPELNPSSVFEYSPQLFRAYADTLEILGRQAESEHWFELANRAEVALGAKNAPAVETVAIVEEIVIPEPYESRGERPTSRDAGRSGERRDFAPLREARDSGSRDSGPRRDGVARDGGSRFGGSRDGAPRRESRDAGSRDGGPRREPRESGIRRNEKGGEIFDFGVAAPELPNDGDRPGWKKSDE
jgi:23S rRNA pseudouridine2605 synthase